MMKTLVIGGLLVLGAALGLGIVGALMGWWQLGSSQSGAPLEAQVRPADGMEMLPVPAGKFDMGSEEGDDDEKPVHTVNLDAFYIDKYEVSVAQYQKCVDAGACAEPFTWPAFSEPNAPVVGVTWNDAANYCAWAGARLPTEAEWEKAARGTDGRTYPWGDQDPDCSLGNHWFGEEQCAGKPVDVGQYPAGASPYGALDMAGNAFEWTADWYATDYYGDSPARNPKGPEAGTFKVVRGGSWDWDELTATDRHTVGLPSDPDSNFGFRCAATP
jgi:formylglycine-generating enzyme required for sulfatase activity